jgi:ELWxxDGT repeat protein
MTLSRRSHPSIGPAHCLENLESRTLLAAAHTASAVPTPPMDINGHLLFVADDGTHGRELFTTAGTAATTKLFRDVAPGAASGVLASFTLGKNLFVVGDNGMWKTDGTAGGTTQVLAHADWMDSLIVGPQVGALRYFGVTYGEQRGLWKTDGTANGTTLVQKYNYYINFLGQANGSVIYMANDWDLSESTRGEYHFFASGGSAGAQEKLMDESVHFSETSRILNTVNSARGAKGDLYFSLADPVDPQNITWWKTSGAAAGTTTVSGPPADILLDHNGTQAGDVGYFFEKSGAQTELWITDGTDAGTHRVKTVGVSVIDAVGGDDGSLYFFAESRGKKQIWKSNGTSSGTKLAVTLPAVTLNDPPIFASVIDGVLYFSPNDGVHGWELWKANSRGAALITDLNQEPASVPTPTIDCVELVGKSDNVVETNRPTFLIRDYGEETIGAIFVDGVEVIRKPTPAFAEMQVPSGLPAGEHLVFAGIGGADGELVALSKALTIVVTGDGTQPAAPPPPTLSNGILQIAGTEATDSILLYRRASKPTMLQVDVNGAVSTFRLKGLIRIQISAGGSADNIKFDEVNGAIAVASKINAGAGNDVILTGSGADRISGGTGDDWINGGAGNDAIYGDSGNDKLFGGAGADYLVGGSGSNVFRGGAGVDRIIATIGLDDTKGNAGDKIIRAT